jgi:hypothetical protein
VLQDDAFFPGCPYSWAIKTYYERLNSTFTDYYDEIIPTIKDSLQAAFNLSNDVMSNFSFPNAGSCNDYLQAENFEGGVPPRYRFTAEERYYIRNIQKISLTVPIGKTGR